MHSWWWLMESHPNPDKHKFKLIISLDPSFDTQNMKCPNILCTPFELATNYMIVIFHCLLQSSFYSFHSPIYPNQQHIKFWRKTYIWWSIDFSADDPANVLLFHPKKDERYATSQSATLLVVVTWDLWAALLLTDLAFIIVIHIILEFVTHFMLTLLSSSWIFFFKRKIVPYYFHLQMIDYSTSSRES